MDVITYPRCYLKLNHVSKRDPRPWLAYPGHCSDITAFHIYIPYYDLQVVNFYVQS